MVNISKNGDVFVQFVFIESVVKQFGVVIVKENNLQGLEKLQFVECLVLYYVDWNVFYLFCEGNGCMMWELIGQIVCEVGYELDQICIDNSKDQWNVVVCWSFYGDLVLVKEIFMDVI